MKHKKGGFTLIEMLIVIVIILILSGMVIKIMSLVSNKAGVSHCVHDLLQIENALAEYYSEYGQYPPGIGDPQENVDYEFENSHSQPPGVMKTFLTSSLHTNINDIANYVPDINVYYGHVPPYLRDIPKAHQVDPKDRFNYNVAKWGLGYRYGLASHLWSRCITNIIKDSVIGEQVYHYREDTERDKIAKKRWAHFLVDVSFSYRRDRSYRKDLDPIPGSELYQRSGRYEYHKFSTGGSGAPEYYNNVYTILDTWGHGLYYTCKPPYQSYKLWSAGPNGRSDGDYAKDDVHTGIK